MLDLPVGRREVVVVVANLIAIFEDAADLNAGEGEDFAAELVSLSFEMRMSSGLPSSGTMVPSAWMVRALMSVTLLFVL